MISDFKGKTAVLTGAGSGFGLECARIGARLGMNLVLVDVQQDALDAAAAEMRAAGAQVLRKRHARSLLMTQRLQRPHVYHRFYLHTALDRQATSGKNPLSVGNLATNCEIEDQVFSSTWRSLSAAKLRRNLYAIGSIW